jgi:predicted dienelactone hydrolase
MRWMILILLAALCAIPAAAAGPTLGLSELPANGGDGPVTVFYPAATPELPWVLGGGRLRLSVARDAPAAPGNGRLVMVSHGSGGSPWVHADLARALVTAGYTVAVPRHRGDNHLDDGEPGPASWQQRPAEVSRAIDAVAADPRFASTLRLDRVGVYGMSAGGHTALTLAGGQWSPALMARHCEQHVADDFNACAGLATGLSGGWLDGLRLWLVRSIVNATFAGDDTPRSHIDARIAAVVAAVPYAADFDMATLATPRVPLALATAAGDTWLHPRFHSDRVLASCTACEHWPAPALAGHGAYLSPLPAGFTGLAGRLLNDPPGFERPAMAAIDRQIVAFFNRHLGR